MAVDDHDNDHDHDNDNDAAAVRGLPWGGGTPASTPHEVRRLIPLDPTWRQLAADPIPGGAPFGVDPANDPAFEAVETEIQRLNTDPAAVNWEQIAASAAGVLRERGKDWRMACRLAAALYQLHGYAGLASGLGVLADLITEPAWGQIFPPLRRLRLRGAYLEWLGERLTNALEKADEPDAAAAEPLTAAADSLAVIDDRLAEALGDFAPILYPLRTALERLQGAAVAKAQLVAQAAAQAAAQAEAAAVQAVAQAATETPAAPAGQPPATPTPAATPPAPPPAAPATPLPAIPSAATSGDAAKALRELKAACVALAANLREQRLSDPRAYLLLRQGIWMDLERLPPNREGGLTDLPEPSLERRRLFDELSTAGDWPRLINEVEKTLGAGSIYWLDGHRLVANALEAMPGCNDARNAVVGMLGLLLKRLPGLERLKFQQGSGFADGLTQAWIAGEVLAAPAPAGAGGGGDGAPAPWVEAAREAAALAIKGKTADGLALFRAGVAGAANERERFCWQLAQASACIDAGLHAIAAVQVAQLEQLVGRYQLEQWEPALALEVARLYLGARAGLPEAPMNAADDAMHRRLLARLYCYDVGTAVALTGP